MSVYFSAIDVTISLPFGTWNVYKFLVGQLGDLHRPNRYGPSQSKAMKMVCSSVIVTAVKF